MREVIVVVSIDTEEDNWHRTRSGVTVENIAELRGLAGFFDRLGIRPTYFTSYQVAIDPRHSPGDLVHPGHARGGQGAGGPLDPQQSRGQAAGHEFLTVRSYHEPCYQHVFRSRGGDRVGGPGRSPGPPRRPSPRC